MNFINRIKEQMNNHENQRGHSRNIVTVDRNALRELVHHFESMDSAIRAEKDALVPDYYRNRTHSLIVELQAMFHNSGAEETMDIVMFTITELRKKEIKVDRDALRKKPLMNKYIWSNALSDAELFEKEANKIIKGNRVINPSQKVEILGLMSRFESRDVSPNGFDTTRFQFKDGSKCEFINSNVFKVINDEN